MKETTLKFVFNHRRQLIVLLHMLLIVASFFSAFLLRFDFYIPPQYLSALTDRLVILLPLKMTVFYFFGLYSGMWKFVNVNDLWNVVKANALATLLFILIDGFVFRFEGFPRTVVLVDFILCVMFMVSVRVSVRYYKEYRVRFRQGHRREHNILIVGAGEAGVLLLNEINKNPSMGHVVAFVDDDRNKMKETINGVKIVGYRHDIPKIVDKFEVDEIILAIPSAEGETVRGVLAYCEQTTAKIRVVPGLNKIISGEMEVRPRDVRPDDLLGRETVNIDMEQIRHYIEGRVVLVTGAGGSIGSELCRQVAEFSPKEVIFFDHYENNLYFLVVDFKTKYPHVNARSVIGDVRDVGLLMKIFKAYKPQVVFHAAAHKHVPLMEENPTAAVKNNVDGTRNMIYASHHYGAERFVLISTDKAVNPVNVMGMSKRIAEMVLQNKAVKSRTKFMAVRFGNVLGSAGSVVPLFKRQIEDGGPITITHPDVKRYFMSIKEAVMLVLQAGGLGKGGELFILDMGEQIKVLEIAKNLIKLSGLEPDKDIKINIVGLRPGEKLEEELLLDKEKDVVTMHDRIYVSRSRSKVPGAELNRRIRELHRVARAMEERVIVDHMRAIIAEDYSN